MSAKRPPRPTIQLPSSPVVQHAEALARTTQAHLQSTRIPTPKEHAIDALVREDLARQRGIAIKIEHAQGLTQVLVLRTRQRFVEFVDTSEALRRQPRPVVDQADIEATDTFLRQYLLNSQVAILQGGVEQLIDIATTPLNPPEGEELIEIEQRPGLLGWLLGQQVTRVRR